MAPLLGIRELDGSSGISGLIVDRCSTFAYNENKRTVGGDRDEQSDADWC